MTHSLPRAYAGLALCTSLTLGCLARAPEETVPTPAAAAQAVEAEAEPEPTMSLADLYARLYTSRRAYEAGLESILAGDEVEGETGIAKAVEGLNACATDCARIDGCDMDLVVYVFDHLLNQQNIALKNQASRMETLETSLQNLEEEASEREPGTSPFTAPIPEIERTVSLLRGTELREIIALNGPVKAALNDWLTWMRPLLIDSWENYQFLRADIAPVYEDAGLPEALLFGMIATETGGKVHSYSRAGAAGLLQFMRRTGLRYGLNTVGGFDMRLDPVAATRANVAYLNDQFEAFNNDLEKALAAYNGGEARVNRLDHRLRGASFWDSNFYYSLPRETREYVPRILAAAWLFLHPEEYNLQFPQVRSDRTELVLRADIALSELTICLGQEGNPEGWFRTLRNLNPRLDPGKRIKAGSTIVAPLALVAVYEERCVDGEVLARARELHDAGYAKRPETIPYVVRRGDTLGKIAARHRCVTVRELAAINRIRPPRYVIHVGQRIKIPNCG